MQIKQCPALDIMFFSSNWGRRPSSSTEVGRWTLWPATLVPKAENPFRAEEGLPDCRHLDRQHDDAGEQCHRKQEPIFLKIRQRNQRNDEGGTTLLRGTGVKSRQMFSSTMTAPMTRLVASSGVGQRG